jgi:hypothetical protein
MTPNGFCPECGFFQAHGASCPTQLRTSQQRLERAAHLFAIFSNLQMARSRCEADGISEAEVREGRTLAETRRQEHAELVSYLGDPSYGGWTPIAAQPRLALSENILPDELTVSETGVSRSEVIPTMATAAAPKNRAPREFVEFPANVPVTVALKYGHAKTVSSQYGDRFMFSLVDGRVMFLDPDVGSKIEGLGINVRENFTITRKWGEQKSVTSWDVARLPGEQPNGTFVVSAVSDNRNEATPKPPGSAPTADGKDHRKTVGALLIEETNALVDAYAQVLDRTLNTYQGRIKPEEARSLLVTAYIQRSKLSFVA